MNRSKKTLLIIFALLVVAIIGMDMVNAQKKIWFEGSSEIDCTLQSVEASLTDLGAFFVGIVGQMPSMTSVELVEQGSDFVTIQTNEGLMKRTNITKKVMEGKIVLQFDEEYQAGKAITTRSHFMDEFVASSGKVIHRVEISNLKAPGFMGFLYRNFGSSNMGKAFLEAHRTFLEQGNN